MMPVSEVLLFQLDRKIPNVALMRVGAHHRQRESPAVRFRSQDRDCARD